MRGKLIVFEGLEGAGKTTQAHKLAAWLREQGRDVVETRWNSSRLAHKAIKRAKRERMLTTQTYALMHAADFWDRYEREILPALSNGSIVIADRWFYTGLVRDTVRGAGKLSADLYRGVIQPDLLFYIHATPQAMLKRKENGPSYYEAGRDFGSNFIAYQTKIVEEYTRQIQFDSNKVWTLNSEETTKNNHRSVRAAVESVLEVSDAAAA